MWGRTSSAERGSDRFTARRRLRRRRVLVASAILLALLLVAIVYVLNQDFARIRAVNVYGADQSLSLIVEKALEGSYIGLVPHNSSFLYPAGRIRREILSAYPGVAAVSLFRNGLTGLSVKVDMRVPVAAWCGAEPPATVASASSTPPRSDCYVFDASGLIYATTTDTQPINSFIFYAPLSAQMGSSAQSEILGTTLPNAHVLPAAFDFARQLSQFGSPATTVVFRDGEVDDYLASGTRVTYVLGKEQDAFRALSSAKEQFTFEDGSIDYVDLRFDGKVYLKAKK